MHYPAWCVAPNAGIFIEEFNGIIEENTLQYGAAVHEFNKALVL